MFFLMSHIIVNKYYPGISSQIIIGCICYILFFLIMSDLLSDDICEQYRYYIYTVAIIDVILSILH